MNDESVGFFDRRLKLPVYYQIYLTLRDWIYSGTLGLGSQLPTEAELCTTFSVSRITIRKAVELLAQDKLVSREQGRGTFVTQKAPDAPFTSEMGQLLRRLETLSEKTTVTDVTVDEIQADDETCSDLQLTPGGHVIRLSHLRLAQGTPTGHVTTYVPSNLGLGFTPEEIESTSTLNLVERKGVELGSADQLISATLADLRDAKLLHVDIGAPLVHMRLVAKDLNFRPVHRMIASYRADYYQHHIHLVRQPNTKGEANWAPLTA